MKIFNKIKKINLLDGYLFISFFCIWFSINSGPIDINKFFEYLNSTYYSLDITSVKYFFLFKLFINFLRAISPLLILLINVLIIFYNFKKKNTFKLNQNYSILFFLFFSLIQIFVLIYLNQDNFFYSVYWNLVMISVLTLFIILIFLDKKFNYFFFLISILILWIVLCVYGFPTIKDFLYSATTAYGTNVLSIDSYTFDQPRPRVTGLSRTALILYCFHLCLFLKNSNFQYLKMLNFTLFTLLSTIIFLFLTRGGVGGLIIANITLFFVFNNIKFYKRIIFFILITALPIILTFGINKTKSSIFIKDEVLKIKFMDNVNKELNQRYFGFIKMYLDKYKINTDSSDINNLDNREVSLNIKTDKWLNWSTNKKINVFLSERNIFWKAIIDKSKESIVFGFGSQADRRFTGMPVSNGYLYSLICGGLVSLTGLIIFLIIVSKNMFLLIKNKLFNNNLHVLNFSLMIILFFMFRLLFENTFLIFGIDFLMFVQSCIYLENFINRNE